MGKELLITLCGALSIVFSAYVLSSVALKWLPMNPDIRRLYTIGWTATKWPALLYPLAVPTAKALTTGHITFTTVLISSVILLAWWHLRTAARPALAAKIKNKIRTVCLGAGA